jgi:hypothetical protein
MWEPRRPITRIVLHFFYRQSVGLIWRVLSPIAGSLPIQDNTNTEKTQADIHASSRIRTHDPSVWVAKTFRALDRGATVIGPHWTKTRVQMLPLSAFSSAVWPNVVIDEHIWGVESSSLGPETGNPEVPSGFPQSIQTNVWIMPQIRPWHLPSTSFPIHSRITLRADIVQR